METVLFSFKEIFNELGGYVFLALVLGISFLLGLVGFHMKKGIIILKYINQEEQKGNRLNEKGLELKQKGRMKIFIPIIGIFVFYLCVFLFIPTVKYKLFSLLLLIPIILGFFGLFLSPSLDD